MILAGTYFISLLNLCIHYDLAIQLLKATTEKPTEIFKDVNCSIVCNRRRGEREGERGEKGERERNY